MKELFQNRPVVNRRDAIHGVRGRHECRPYGCIRALSICFETAPRARNPLQEGGRLGNQFTATSRSLSAKRSFARAITAWASGDSGSAIRKAASS